MKQLQNDNEINLLKQQIGFGLAFKATLGFYAARLIAHLVQLAILAGIIGTAVLIFNK